MNKKDTSLPEKIKQLQTEVAKEREFVDMATHQLQEPLASMKWTLENILSGRSGEINVETRQAIKKVYTANENTIKLMRDLLIVARLESGRLQLKTEPTDLLELVQKIIKQHDSDIKEHLGEMHFTSPKGPLPKIPTDITLLSQAIDNLISKAIKYNPIKTHITVSVFKESNQVKISIKNRGPSIPKEKQSKLFEKFTRAKTKGTQKTSGTGLGLHITKQIIELHGGEVSFSSEKNEGTTFTIILPIS
jgi:signal transduction histidine kinase